MSEPQSSAIVQAVLAGSKRGYVLKSDGPTELLKGIEAVRQSGFHVRKTVADRSLVEMEHSVRESGGRHDSEPDTTVVERVPWGTRRVYSR